MVTAILIMDVNDDLEVCELVLEVLTCYLLVQKITKYIKSKEFNYFWIIKMHVSIFKLMKLYLFNMPFHKDEQIFLN